MTAKHHPPYCQEEQELMRAPLRSSRRDLLRSALGFTAYVAAPAWAQAGKPSNPTNTLLVAQIIDNTPSQLDVSRDFLIGSRAAWQDINARGGINGRPIRHLPIEVDGSSASLQAAVDTIKKLPNCIAIAGTAGDRAATQLVTLMRQDQHEMAHVAPWLQNSALDGDNCTFPIFASRQEQISYALNSLSTVGVTALGAVYASEQEYSQYRSDVEQASAVLKIKLKTYKSSGDLSLIAKTLTPDTPRILLFIGGTPELVQFTQAIEKQALQRYIVAMADVNLQTMMQSGQVRHTTVIATQVVPMVNSTLPVVRAYRESMTRFFDEPATPQSLAGYIAARYTSDVLKTMDGTPSRQNTLRAFQQRNLMDIGGFRVSFNAQNRSGAYVTQSMITAGGRLVG